MKTTSESSSGRRTFLKGVAVVGGAATVAAVGGVAVASAPAGSPAGVAPAAAKPQGYRETEHVREYYRLAQL